MWIQEMFKQKPVMGMVHLDALPGTVFFDEENGLAGVLQNARRDYEALVAGGIDAVIFCNENDKPYAKRVGQEVVAAMTRVVLSTVCGAPKVPFGIDIQWDVPASLAVAMATGAGFVRGIACGTYCGDLGPFAPDTGHILKYRKLIRAEHVKIVTNLMPEFSSSLDTRPPALVAQTVAKSTRLDGVCVSGAMAGRAAPFEQLGEIKAAVGGYTVLANTGVNFETVGETLHLADGCVVATCLKEGGLPGGRIETQRVQRLMEHAKQSFERSGK